MRLILSLFLASCAGPVDGLDDVPDTGTVPSDTQDTDSEPGDSGWEDESLPPPAIDQAAPAHVELATFALG